MAHIELVDHETGRAFFVEIVPGDQYEVTEQPERVLTVLDVDGIHAIVTYGDQPFQTRSDNLADAIHTGVYTERVACPGHPVRPVTAHLHIAPYTGAADVVLARLVLASVLGARTAAHVPIDPNSPNGHIGQWLIDLPQDLADRLAAEGTLTLRSPVGSSLHVDAS